MFNIPKEDPQGGSWRNTAIQRFKELVQRLFQGVHNKVNPSNEHQTQNILKTMEQKYQKLDMYTANMLTIINNTQPTQSEAMKYREYMRDIDNNIVTVLGDIITQYEKLKKICPYITCKIKMDIETIEKTKNIIQTTLNQGGGFDELEGILTQSLEDMQKKSANINNSLEVIKQSNLFDAINNLIKIYNNYNIEDIKNHIQSTYEKLETYLTNGRERSDQDKQQAFVKLYQIQNLLHILKDKISQNSDEKDTKDIMTLIQNIDTMISENKEKNATQIIYILYTFFTKYGDILKKNDHTSKFRHYHTEAQQ